ncbi:MAG: 4-hydroxy-tetrahydrodipicolinate reductase [Planctomycetaceae bacterium]|nr:4-hydroxy-tetrahydrodipicolinate reductase [Planctomycetaceae bacterium]
MSQRLRVAVHGAAGRMGQRIVACTLQDSELQLAAALDSSKCPRCGEDAGEVAGCGKTGIAIASELSTPVDVVIDFSIPEATEHLVPLCVARKLPLVVATTGMNETQKAAVQEAAKQIPIVWSPSMSVAVNLLMKLVRDAARVLKASPEGVDVEIIERHHRFKEDAPSGTALAFGRIVAEEMGQTDHIHGRSGRPGQRPHKEIGYHALRTGDNVGEHTIVFGLMGETIDLSVRSQTRDSYAYGALAAAKFLVQQNPGLYSMADVLKL